MTIMNAEATERTFTYPSMDAKVIEDLKKAGYRRIALQVPGGLIPQMSGLVQEIEGGTGASVIHVARPCFGACDPPDHDEMGGAEALIAMGHAPIPNMPHPIPTHLVEMRSTMVNTIPLVNLVVKSGLPKKLGGVASIQHIDLLHPLAAALKEEGYSLQVGTGGKRLGYPGQALGCNYSSATSIEPNVDGFLLLGTGTFHPMGLALSVSKPVWSLDPLQTLIDGPLDRETMVKKRLLEIGRAMDARNWGILTSTFAGQLRMPLAEKLREKARERGRDAGILTFGRLDPSDLVGLHLDAYVVTACPRIALDDGHMFNKPILTPPEFLSAIGDRPLTPYLFDTFP
jgi:2-(3-amino-3-carboxypropyl)histidine synthase